MDSEKKVVIEKILEWVTEIKDDGDSTLKLNCILESAGDWTQFCVADLVAEAFEALLKDNELDHKDCFNGHTAISMDALREAIMRRAGFLRQSLLEGKDEDKTEAFNDLLTSIKSLNRVRSDTVQDFSDMSGCNLDDIPTDYE